MKHIVELTDLRLSDKQGKTCASRQDLEALYHLPLIEAARIVGKGTTSFKKACRAAGIQQWPYRKLKSLRSMVSVLRKFSDREELGEKCADVQVTYKYK